MQKGNYSDGKSQLASLSVETLGRITWIVGQASNGTVGKNQLDNWIVL
jgi:hypothetical protein